MSESHGTEYCHQAEIQRLQGCIEELEKPDVNHQQQKESLGESESLFQYLFEQTHDAVFILDLAGRHIISNQRAATMLGYTKEEMASLSVNETSAEREKSKSVLERLLAGEHIPLYERLFRKKDGQIIPVEINAELIRGKNNEPIYIQSVVRDISERKRVEQQLRESEFKYRIVADNTHDWEFWLSPSGKFIYTSPSCKDITGYEADEFKRTPHILIKIIHPEDLAGFLAHQKDVAKKREKGEVEFRIQKPDGNIIWIDHVCQPIFDDNGAYLGARGSNRDITRRKIMEAELKEANEKLNAHICEIEQLQSELREQALHDPLTGLYNRRYLNEALEREITRAKREDHCLSVIISDIDHFKKINDTYGHQVGDKFLTEIAAIMKNYARSSDIICRYGGEEFLLILPGATKAAAMKRARELKRSCAGIRILQEGKRPKVTLSFGVATFPIHGQEAGELIIKADKAMYRSKDLGRNRVTAWDEKGALS
ncbi:MAG: diguanylate cyclase [Chloroflexi bacterium]|nr:diguanylate cyclase [Chloroflexota bacterium]